MCIARIDHEIRHFGENKYSPFITRFGLKRVLVPRPIPPSAIDNIQRYITLYHPIPQYIY